MTFLEALYGSQYNEIKKNGGNGDKGRLNGNLFLSALIILAILTVFMLMLRFVTGFEDKWHDTINSIFGSGVFNGKAMGKILAIPLLAVIYFTLTKTVGNEINFKQKVDTFMNLPEDVQKKANAKILIPFFILLAIFAALAFTSL